MKKDVRLRANFFGLLARSFFGGDGVVGAVPHASRDGPIEGERHHQDEAGEALGVTASTRSGKNCQF